MGLYEVSDVRRGESSLARDLIRRGEPIRVSDRTLTQMLVDWDLVAKRLVTVGCERQATSSVLAIDRPVGDEIIAALERMRDRVPVVSQATADATSPERPREIQAQFTCDDAILRAGAPILTTL